MECHDRYLSQGRRTRPDLQRRKGDASELTQKSVAIARLLALSPDLLGRSEPLHELGMHMVTVTKFLHTISMPAVFPP